MARGGVASAPAPGRPRSEEAHRAILDATLALLSETGYSALTIEGIAARARVGKATIYRRWASKLPLVIEAFAGLPGLEEVDSGDLAADLKQMLRSYLRDFHATPLGRVYPSLVGERLHNPELSKLFEPVTRARRQPLVRRLQTAARLGEIPRGTDLQLVADLLVGPISVRLFSAGSRLDASLVEPTVDLVLGGVRGPATGGRAP